MGRRRSVVPSLGGTWGSIDDAKEVLAWGHRVKADLETLTREGERHEEELLYLFGLMNEMKELKERAEREAVEARTLVANFEEEARREREAQRAVKEELRAARAEIAVLHQAKSDLSKENDDLENRLQIIRDNLPKFGGMAEAEKLAHVFDRSHQLPASHQSRRHHRTLEHSSAGNLAELSEIYDHSESSMDALEVSTLRNGRQWKRSSQQPAAAATTTTVTRTSRSTHKRSSSRRRSKSQPHVSPPSYPVSRSTTTQPSAPPMAVGEDVGGLAMAGQGSEGVAFRSRRSQSENRLATPARKGMAAEAAYHRSMANLRSPRPEPSWLPTGCPISQKQHTFVKFSSLRPESCYYCDKRITFGSKGFRCDECKYLAHLECRNHVPIPCVPRPVTATPTKSGRLASITLGDFLPPLRPKIPALLVHAVTEIERRGNSGLHSLGLYRVPGTLLLVKNLVEAFLMGRLPDMSRVDDVHVIASAVKNFLARLRDPLIPALSVKDFILATGAEDVGMALDFAVQELPVGNRDCLAFLCLHWQRVARAQSDNRMPIEQLAKILAPTVCGDPSPKGAPMAQALEANQSLVSVMDSLLRQLSTEYWETQLMLGAAHPLLSCPPESSPHPYAHSHLPSRSSSKASPSLHLNTTLAGGSSRSREPMGPLFSKPKI